MVMVNKARCRSMDSVVFAMMVSLGCTAQVSRPLEEMVTLLVFLTFCASRELMTARVELSSEYNVNVAVLMEARARLLAPSLIWQVYVTVHFSLTKFREAI